MAARDLTPAERKALRTYCEYETHEKAAEQLGISPQTLKNHLGSIYKKVDRRKAHSALYRMCLEAGFDPLSDLPTTSTSAGGPLVNSESTTLAAETGPE